MSNSIYEIHETKRTARIAGIWYLILAITSSYSWLYISDTIIPGNASLTTNNIIASSPQYLVAIISNIIGQICFILLALALNRLLNHINKSQARLMLVFVLVSVPVMFVNILFQTASYIVVCRAEYLKVFSAEQIASLSMLFLNLYTICVHILETLWGLWLFPLSYLIYNSKLFPRILAILLTISGVCYLIGSLTSLAVPSLFAAIEKYLGIPEAAGELALVLWLLIKGVKAPETSSAHQ